MVDSDQEFRGGSTGLARPAPGRAAVLVLAGGSGTRVGAGTNKVYLPLAGRRVISWSFVWAAQVPAVGPLVLVVRREDADLAAETVRRELPDLDVRLVVGGRSRHESEQAGLDLLAPLIERGEIDVVAVHDGARPLAGPALFATAITTADEIGGAVPGLPAEDLLPGHLLSTDAPATATPDDAPPDAGTSGSAPLDPAAPDPAAFDPGALNPGALDPGALDPGAFDGGLVRVQTPQAFRAAPLLAAYRAASAGGYRGTDTASSVETFSDLTVRVVPGSRHNVKVTYPHDLLLVERLLAAHHHRMP